MNLSKLVKTKRDASVWVISSIWLIVNFVLLNIWGNGALIFTNPICLALIAAFVFYSKSNPKLNDWLNSKI